MAANQGYIVHPSSAKIEMGAAHTMGTDNAQLALMRHADEQCQMLMLGQNLTSSSPVNGGTRAQGEVHMDVRQERLDEHCKWIARILTEQFAVSILKQNYGKSYDKNPERPTITPDNTQPMTPTEKADYLQKLSNSRIPVLAEPTYKAIGEQEPQPGDKVLVAGELMILEEPMTKTEKQEKYFDTQMQQQDAVNQKFGEPGGQPGEQQVAQAVAQASEDDRRELETLVLAAERAPHLNGEAVAVAEKLKQLVTKARR
jgi:phage gp29-like protein